MLGTVKDASGGVVPGVTVTLKNASTGITADDDHRHQRQLPIPATSGSAPTSSGRELQGFSTAEAKDVVVTVNARQRVDLTLQVGDVSETVGSPAPRRCSRPIRATAARSSTKEQIVNLPLNGRTYADLALLSPGVRKSAISDSRDASFNVNGLRSALNSFMLDGVDNNSYGTSNQGFSNQVVQLSPDAVEEFKVQTNNFSAEYGRAGGAVINASHPQRHQPVPRLRLGVPSQYRAERGRLLQAVERREAELNRNQFGVVLRRPDRPQPALLLRRLRRLPADVEDAVFRDDPDAWRSGRASWASRSGIR